jgi:hypothetical protein
MADPSARSRAEIDRDLSALAARRASVRVAIRRRSDDIARAEADLLSYEGEILDCEQRFELLFDERSRVARCLEPVRR